MTHTAYIGLGSNIGDRRKHLQDALSEIAKIPGTSLVRRSRLYATAPWRMGAGTHAFLNACAMIRTELEPTALIDELLAIERRMGRHRARGADGEYLDRTIDLDLLFYDDLIINDVGPPRLRVPHAELANRRFVLEPLCEIAATTVHPELKKSVAVLLAECPDDSRAWPLPG